MRGVRRRPVAVSIVAWLFVATGVAGTGWYLRELARSFDMDAIWAVATAAIAIVSGIWLLRGSNWARWAALAWMACHVVLSAFHSAREFAVHAVLLALIAYSLFRGRTAEYFRGSAASSSAGSGRA